MQRVTRLLITIGVIFGSLASLQAEELPIGIAIVFDTSGSMSAMVKAADGKMEPKYQIGKRALEGVVKRLEEFEKSSGRKLVVGLYIFNGQDGTAAVPIGKFDPVKLRKWLADFSTPSGATPLGNTVAYAARYLVRGAMSARHILVVTDGENTVGPAPDVVISSLQKNAATDNKAIEYHFIAFDVSASTFAPVKKLGATLVSASNEAQLQDKLTFILEEKILLEQE